MTLISHLSLFLYSSLFTRLHPPRLVSKHVQYGFDCTLVFLVYLEDNLVSTLAAFRCAEAEEWEMQWR